MENRKNCYRDGQSYFFTLFFAKFVFTFVKTSPTPPAMPKIREGFKGQRTIIIPSFIIEKMKQNPLGKMLYITDIGFYPTASYHYRERTADEATENVLIYCVRGKGWYSLDKKRYHVTQNQFFILPEHESHAYGSLEDDPWSIYWLHFKGDMAAFFRKGFDVPTHVSSPNNQPLETQLHLFEEIYNTLDNGFGNNNIMYATTSLFHFLGLMKYVGEYIENKNERRHVDATDLAIAFMQENINRKLSLGEIAEEVNLSVSYFSNLFLKKTGFSPLQYLNMLRIRKACHYLDFTNMKINQISPLVGIDDTFYFSRLFTKIMGISPSEYRAHKKG